MATLILKIYLACMSLNLIFFMKCGMKREALSAIWLRVLHYWTIQGPFYNCVWIFLEARLMPTDLFLLHGKTNVISVKA